MLSTVFNAILQNAGQTCSAGSRLLIEERRFDEIVDALAERFRGVRIGPALSDPDCGPLVNAAQAERVRSTLADAERAGLPLVASAVVPADAPGGGNYVAPCLYAPVDPEHPLAREEIFGPVLVATPFRDEDEAVALANATDYGLVAGVWTRDGARQLRLARDLKCGQVFINC